MTYYALFYDVVEDYLSRRWEFRDEHLDHARRARDRGDLILAGAFDPPDGALLVFRGEDESVASEFAGRDPYVQNGIVTDWEVREWSVVVAHM